MRVQDEREVDAVEPDPSVVDTTKEWRGVVPSSHLLSLDSVLPGSLHPETPFRGSLAACRARRDSQRRSWRLNGEERVEDYDEDGSERL